MSTPPFPPSQGLVPENQTYENHAAHAVEPNTGLPPPVYMPAPTLNQTPSYNFVVEEPPPYVPPKEAEETVKKKRKICGMKLSSAAATLAIIVAAAVIAGGIYGYQQKIQ